MTTELEQAVAAAAHEAVTSTADRLLGMDAVTAAVIDRLGGGRLPDDLLAEILEEALRHDGTTRLVATPGRRVADLDRLLDGIVLTHRLTEAEHAAHALDLDPDLGPLARLAWSDGGLHTPDGTPLRRRDRRVRGASRAGGVLWTTRLEGPHGWLDGFEPGTLLGLRTGGGVLRVEAVMAPELSEGPGPVFFGEALARVFDDANQGDGLPVWDETLHVGLVADRPEWFAQPGPPFGELVAAAGFEVDGRSVGRPGCWEAHEKLARVVMAVSRHEDLLAEDHRVLADALEAFDAWCAGSREVRESLARRLHERWQAALAFLDEIRWRGATAGQLAGFAGVVTDAARGEAASAAHWLASRAAALDGRPLDAERLVAAAQSADPTFPPAVDEAAWYASDRGQARDAVNLLHRVRRHDDPELNIFRTYAALGAPGVGRNAPCPCGSGRKFKHCHLGRMELPEPDRVRWLLDKARDFIVRVAPPDEVEELEGHDPEPSTHLLAFDALLFRDGWLDRFLASRGPLLDDWELTTARRWATGSTSSLFRVAGVDARGRRQLVDLADGALRTVEPSVAFEAAALHRLLWCRLVPVGDLWYGTGVVRLATLRERERLLDVLGDPDVPSSDVVRALVGGGDGPQLQNTSGEPPVMCRTTLRRPPELDGRDVIDLLDKSPLERGEQEWDGDDVGGTGSLVWHLVRDTGGLERATIGTVRLAEGGDLTVATSSVTRQDEMLALVADALGRLDLVSDERVPIARVRAEQHRAASLRALRGALGLDDVELDDSELDDWELDDELDDRELDDRELDDELDDSELDDWEEDDADALGSGRGERSPELAAALDTIMRQAEERWLDQPVPALGGATPRAAAADERLRPDVLTLLAEVRDRGPGLGGFDADRLRAALGVS